MTSVPAERGAVRLGREVELIGIAGDLGSIHENGDATFTGRHFPVCGDDGIIGKGESSKQTRPYVDIVKVPLP